jgi:hypothetical protein
MSDLRIPPTLSAATSIVGTAPSGRGKTIATRLPQSEMEAVEAAAKTAGKSASVWLREAAIAHLNRPAEIRKTLPDPTLLAEILGLRNLTINLLSAVALDLPKETIQRIVTHADATKQGKAEEVLRRLQDEANAQTVAK